MKTMKKTLAIFLAMTLVLSLVPMSVSAAHQNVATTLDGLTIAGVDVFGYLNPINAANSSQALTGIQNPTTLRITEALAARPRAELLRATEESTAFNVIHIPLAGVGDLTANMTLSAVRILASNNIAEWEDQPLLEGDILVVIDGDSHDAGTDILFGSFIIEFGTLPSAQVTGESTLHDIILNVIVPTELDFELNPFQIGITPIDSDTERYDSQLTGTEFEIVNATSGVPVFVGFELQVEGDNGAAFVADRAELNRDDVNETAKNIFFAALAANSAGNFVADNVVTTGNVKVATMSDAMVPFDITDDEDPTGDVVANFAFSLAPPIDTDNAKTEFRFYAEMNTHAEWQAGDVTVTGVYNLAALRAATASDIELTNDGHRLIASADDDSSSNDEPWGTPITATTTLNAVPMWNASAPLQLQFPAGTPGPARTSTNIAGLDNPWPNTRDGGTTIDWSYNQENGRFELSRIANSGTQQIVRIGDITVTINYIRP